MKFIFDKFGPNIWELGFFISKNMSIDIFVYLGFVVIIACVSYFVGSVNTAVVLSKLINGEDIRTKGSGNAGTTNVLRTYGVGPAALTLFGDMLKTLIGMAMGTCLLGFTGAYVAGLFCVLGHVVPIYYRFRGGKGVATVGMMVLYIKPLAFLILVIIFIGVTWMTKYLSMGSMVAVAIMPLILSRFDNVPDGFPIIRLLITLIIMGIVFYRHRSNLIRVIEKRENKFSFKKTSKHGDKNSGIRKDKSNK